MEGSGVDSAVGRDGEERRMDRGDDWGGRSGNVECRDCEWGREWCWSEGREGWKGSKSTFRYGNDELERQHDEHGGHGG